MKCLVVAITAIIVLTVVSEYDKSKGWDRAQYLYDQSMSGADRNLWHKPKEDNMAIPDSLKHRFPKWEQNRRYK